MIAEQRLMRSDALGASPPAMGAIGISWSRDDAATLVRPVVVVQCVLALPALTRPIEQRLDADASLKPVVADSDRVVATDKTEDIRTRRRIAA